MTEGIHTGPRRIRLSREKGFRLQEHSQALNGRECVKVDRSGPWGNRYRIGGPVFREKGFGKVCDAAEAVELFQRLQLPHMRDIAQLRGKNLACWCGLCGRHRDGKPFGVSCPDCAPCHADPLGQRANLPIRDINQFSNEEGPGGPNKPVTVTS